MRYSHGRFVSTDPSVGEEAVICLICRPGSLLAGASGLRERLCTSRCLSFWRSSCLRKDRSSNVSSMAPSAKGKATSQSRRLLVAGLSADDGLLVAALAAALRSCVLGERRFGSLLQAPAGIPAQQSVARRPQHKIYGKFVVQKC